MRCTEEGHYGLIWVDSYCTILTGAMISEDILIVTVLFGWGFPSDVLRFVLPLCRSDDQPGLSVCQSQFTCMKLPGEISLLGCMWGSLLCS